MSASTSSFGGAGGAGGLSLDDLVALNDEIVALVRAGLPLEPGLTGARRDLRGRLGRVVDRLSTRLGSGESLPEALEAERDAIPPVYRAVVEAGLLSGRPASALEGLADYVRRYLETRRVLGLALMYPLVVLLLAYALFVGFVTFVAPRFVEAFESLRVPGRGGVALLARLGELAPYWAPILPAIVAILIVGWWSSGRSGAFAVGLGSVPMRLVPWFGGMLAEARTANFADLLAILLEGGVALPAALELAADATGDAATKRDARTLADAIRRGESPAEALEGARAGAGGSKGALRSFPPLLRWLLAIGERRGAVAPALRHAADVYRRRAIQRAELIRTFLPTLLVLVVGIATVLIYALLLFVPFTSLLDGLTSASASL